MRNKFNIDYKFSKLNSNKIHESKFISNIDEIRINDLFSINKPYIGWYVIKFIDHDLSDNTFLISFTRTVTDLGLINSAELYGEIDNDAYNLVIKSAKTIIRKVVYKILNSYNGIPNIERYELSEDGRITLCGKRINSDSMVNIII
jgi:hypothetical protein